MTRRLLILTFQSQMNSFQLDNMLAWFSTLCPPTPLGLSKFQAFCSSYRFYRYMIVCNNLIIVREMCCVHIKIPATTSANIERTIIYAS